MSELNLNSRLRAPGTVLVENREAYNALFSRVKDRHENPEAFLGGLSEAYAAGEPGLLDQHRIEYMTEEARARSFADQFGIVSTEGAPNQVPYMVFLEPDSVDMFDVALVGPEHDFVQRVQIYSTTDTYFSTGWKELSTPKIEYDGNNPFFPDKAAVLEAQAMDKAVYYYQRKLDSLSWNTLADSIGSFTGKKIWTFQDSDVQDLPTTNNVTAGSAKSFWRNLRDEVFPYFDAQGKGDRVIDIHLRATDLKYLFAVAPVGATLGGFSEFQAEVYRGVSERVLEIYGHGIRIHPENNRIASGYFYTRVGPCFKIWIPKLGDVQNAVPDTPGYRAFRLRTWYAILQPSLWNSNVAKFQWSTSDTNG